MLWVYNILIKNELRLGSTVKIIISFTKSPTTRLLTITFTSTTNSSLPIIYSKPNNGWIIITSLTLPKKRLVIINSIN